MTAEDMRDLRGMTRQLTEALRNARKTAAYTPTLEQHAENETGVQWERAAHISIVGLFLMALLVGMSIAQPVIVPVVLAWAIATILLPVINLFERKGIRRGFGVALVTVGLLAVIVSIVAFLSIPLTYWLGRASELGVLLKTKLATLSEPLTFLQDIIAAVNEATGGGTGSGITVEDKSNIVGGIMSVLTPAVSQGILFFGALIFYLTYQSRIKNGIVSLMPDRDTRLIGLRILNDVERNMTVYFGTFTVVNICLGLVTIALATAVGLPNPLLWGVLAMVANYVPYIGVAVVVAVLFVVGLFVFPTIVQAIIAPAAYVAITTVEGHFLTPAIFGHRLTLNPFAVFLSIAFWTWLWGPIGAFLAVPILMVLMVVIRHLRNDDSIELPA